MQDQEVNNFNVKLSLITKLVCFNIKIWHWQIGYYVAIDCLAPIPRISYIFIVDIPAIFCWEQQVDHSVVKMNCIDHHRVCHFSFHFWWMKYLQCNGKLIVCYNSFSIEKLKFQNIFFFKNSEVISKPLDQN